MARQENPPFERGQTFFQGATTNLVDGANLEGSLWTFSDLDYSQSGQRSARTGREVKCMVVRNRTGSAMLPKLIAKLKVDGSAYEFGGQVNGYATTVGEVGYPIDEYLPAAGVPDGDLFFVVVKGPAMCTTAAAGDTTISTGSKVIPSTGGKVIDQDITVAAGAATFNQIQGAIGRCMLAVNGTNSNILIDVGAN